MKTGITILVVMFVSITILLIIAYTLKSREKYYTWKWNDDVDSDSDTGVWGEHWDKKTGQMVSNYPLLFNDLMTVNKITM